MMAPDTSSSNRERFTKPIRMISTSTSTKSFVLEVSWRSTVSVARYEYHAGERGVSVVRFGESALNIRCSRNDSRLSTLAREALNGRQLQKAATLRPEVR